MGYNSIWNGDVRLKLKQSEIHPDCDWAYGNYHGNRIAVVNLAFGKLHAGRKSIGKCQNPKLAQRLKESLDNAGKSGYNDMQDACEHVSDRLNKKYVWTDTATKFASIPGWKDEKNYIIPAVHGQLPDGPVNFLDALKSQLKDQKEEWIEKYLPATDGIVKGFEKSKYDGVVASLKSFNKDLDDLDKMAWLFDTEDVIEFKSIKKKLSYSKLLVSFDGALKDLEKYRAAGMSDKQSAAFLALKTAVGLVPVFGSFYQEIVDNCPTLIGNFKKTCEDRQRKMLGLAGY